MNDITEILKDTQESSSMLPKDSLEFKADFSEIKDVWQEFLRRIHNDSAESLDIKNDVVSEVVDGRDYKVHECADVAKECFTREIIENWGNMDLTSRNDVIQKYASGLGLEMEINFQGIVWQEFPIENGRYTYGYNAGDGYVHLNMDLLSDPKNMIHVIDTVAHEARHQLQNEAIENPDKFNIDIATINEWKAGKDSYTLEEPTAYDPWGYKYNPMETDSKFFGESMAREVTKNIINNA